MSKTEHHNESNTNTSRKATPKKQVSDVDTKAQRSIPKGEEIFILEPIMSGHGPGTQDYVTPKLHVPAWRHSHEAFIVTGQRTS